MLRSEFDFLMESYGNDPTKISSEEYRRIEDVYTWYPADCIDKELIVFLVSKFGMNIINDMWLTAHLHEGTNALKERMHRYDKTE